MDKKIDMSVFAGQDFDCEFTNGFWHESYVCRPLKEMVKTIANTDKYKPKTNRTRYYNHCRPRLNKPQVLDDWSWIPDGLIWIAYQATSSGKVIPHQVASDELRAGLQDIGGDPVPFVMAECIGASPEHANHAKELGIPVIGGEV